MTIWDCIYIYVCVCVCVYICVCISIYLSIYIYAWWAAVHGVAKSQTWLSDFTFTFHCHALEKEMATRSSVLAWRIPGTGEPDGLLSMGSHRVGHDWSDLAAAACVGARLRQNLHPNFPMKTGCSFPLDDLHDIRPRLVSSFFMSCFPWDLTGFSGRIF